MSEQPTAVQIGGAEWAIEVCPAGQLFERSGRDLLGQCRYEEATIRLRESMPPARMAQVLWHELIHAIADNIGMELPETTVAALAAGTFEVLRNSPGLAEYLLSAGRLQMSPVRDPAQGMRDELLRLERTNGNVGL